MKTGLRFKRWLSFFFSMSLILSFHSQAQTLKKQLLGHKKSVLSLAFSQDGKILASGSMDKTIRLWNVATGRLQRTLIGHQKKVLAVTFSPNNELFASGSWDKTIKLWNWQQGKILRTFKNHWKINSVNFSLDGNLLASGGRGPVKLQEVNTGNKINHFSGAHGNSSINMVAFSPTEQTILASAGDDKTVKIWHLTSEKVLHTLKHSNRVNTLAFSPNGSSLISGSDDKIVKLWHVKTGKEICRCQHGRQPNHGINIVAFAPNGSMFVSGNRKGEVFFWNADKCQPLRYQLKHTNSIKALAFSPDSKILAVGGDDKVIKLWQILY